MSRQWLTSEGVGVDETGARQWATSGGGVDEALTPTLVTVTAAVITEAGQAIIVNARTTKAVTAAAVTYAGQTVVALLTQRIATAAATITYAGQSLLATVAGSSAWRRLGLMLGIGL